MLLILTKVSMCQLGYNVIDRVAPDIRLAGSPDIWPEKLFQQIKSKTVEQQIKLQFKIKN